METKIKKGLLLFQLVILFLPFAQHCLPFIESGPLKGEFSDSKDSKFTITKWVDGSYQHQKELYLNDKTGFRPDLIRLNTQLDYSVFQICHAGWTIVGNNNMLYQKPYIEAYFGEDFVGYDTIYEKARKLKAIQDTLARLGKSLILVHAPNKVSYFPEYFPRQIAHKKMGITNLEVYKRLADSMGINQVDMDAWFRSMKGKSRELLFAKQGIHWTIYGCCVAGDSLMRYIEKLRNIRVSHPDWSKIEHTTKGRLGDDDVALELNLIFPVATETFAYPIVREVPDSNAIKPNVIYVGDSYCLKLVAFSVINKMNTQCEYWGYNYDVIHINDTEHNYIPIYDWHGAIAKSDCIVLVHTPFNLRHLGSGFIEAAYDYYYPPKK